MIISIALLTSRDLIFPVALDEYFPSWLNHLMHTTVIPLQVAFTINIIKTLCSAIFGMVTN